jgi:hypothetical protein
MSVSKKTAQNCHPIGTQKGQARTNLRIVLNKTGQMGCPKQLFWTRNLSTNKAEIRHEKLY